MVLLVCQQCAAGTRLLEDESRSKPIEAFRSYEDFGDDCDWILTRDEHDPAGAVVRRRVLRRFVRTAGIVGLGVGGRTIETTAEHPFYVLGRGWTAAGELRPGDVLVSHDGRETSVELIASSGRYATVYNLEVEDCHTYFVGDESWGFSVWAHNARCSTLETEMVDGAERTTLSIKKKFADGTSEARQLEQFIEGWNEEIQRAGGAMTRQRVSDEMRHIADKYAARVRAANPVEYEGFVVGHLPDTGAGGPASGGRTMPLLDDVNSYLAGILSGVKRGTTYHYVKLM